MVKVKKQLRNFAPCGSNLRKSGLLTGWLAGWREYTLNNSFCQHNITYIHTQCMQTMLVSIPTYTQFTVANGRLWWLWDREYGWIHTFIQNNDLYCLRSTVVIQINASRKRFMIAMHTQILVLQLDRLFNRISIWLGNSICPPFCQASYRKLCEFVWFCMRNRRTFGCCLFFVVVAMFRWFGLTKWRWHMRHSPSQWKSRASTKNCMVYETNNPIVNVFQVFSLFSRNKKTHSQTLVCMW